MITSRLLPRKNFGGGIEMPRRPYSSWMTMLESQYRSTAKQRGIEFDLSWIDIYKICTRNCEYCGKPPVDGNILRRNGVVKPYMGIDRIDSEEGYVLGNVVPCCKECNTMKGSRTIDEFRDSIWRCYNTMFLDAIHVID